jgi:hypothetical protein
MLNHEGNTQKNIYEGTPIKEGKTKCFKAKSLGKHDGRT